MKLGIVGGGFVGSATALLQCADIEVITYDIEPSRCHPPGITREDLKTCNLVFVCVPTPSFESGECNTAIVEKCIRQLQMDGIENIVLRSTVPPGTSERLGVSFMPEFLTEVNWRVDFRTCNTWIFGAATEAVQEKFREMINLAHNAGVIESNTTMFVAQKTAELIKYVRNNFLAVKISFFNEIYGIAKAIGVDYEELRAGVTADGRIGKSHTAVPGYDGHFGFGGTCLPKDTSALVAFMDANDVPNTIVRAAVTRNKTIDRTERDWESDPRAFTNMQK